MSLAACYYYLVILGSPTRWASHCGLPMTLQPTEEKETPSPSSSPSSSPAKLEPSQAGIPRVDRLSQLSIYIGIAVLW